MNLMFKRVTILLVIISTIPLAFYGMMEFFNFSPWMTLVDLQRTINSVVYKYLRVLRNDFSPIVALSLFLYSLIYGIVHALGPGHGKLLISASLLDKKDRTKGKFTALLLAFTTACVHVGIAVLLAFLLKFIFVGVGRTARADMMGNFKLVSGILIMLVGVFLMIANLIKKINLGKLPIRMNNSALVGFLAGMVPCPLSMTIMLLSISYSVYYIGLISVAGISSGIFISLFAIGLIVIFLRERGMTFLVAETGTKSKTMQNAKDIIVTFFGILQAILFLLVGLLTASSAFVRGF